MKECPHNSQMKIPFVHIPNAYKLKRKEFDGEDKEIATEKQPHALDMCVFELSQGRCTIFT